MNRTKNNSLLAPSSYPELIRSSLNSNEPYQQAMPFEDQPEMRAMVGQQITTIFFTLFGNLLMIFVILRNNFVLRRKRITPVSRRVLSLCQSLYFEVQLLMLNLCTSDLLFALVTILPNIFMTITVPIFYGPDILCRLVKFLQVLPM